MNNTNAHTSETKKNTPENCERLAWQIVDSMCMYDLCRSMSEHIAANYENDLDLYEYDWENYNGENDNDD